jgi:hypothetical protein
MDEEYGHGPDACSPPSAHNSGGTSAKIRRYLKSVSGVSDVAGRAFGLRRGRVILSGVYDAPEAASPE